MKNIFHIGYHKTGTTWFQKHFYTSVNNCKLVDRQKIRNHFFENKNENFQNNLTQVFCDEELSGNIHNGGLSGFASGGTSDKISEFKNPKVIIVIRNQHNIIASSYLQYVKKGGNFSLNKYLYHTDFPNSNRSALFSFNHFNYLEKIKLYEDKLGEENVFIYLYEDFKNAKEDFLMGFIEEHGFNIKYEDINFKQNNKSYSYFSLLLSRFFNSFTRKDVLYKYYFIHIPFLYELTSSVIKKLNCGKIKLDEFLGRQNRQYILDFYKNSNNVLLEKYNLDLRKYNYPL